MDSLAPVSGKTDQLRRRYGARPPAAGPWNEVIASLMEHRSVRAYKPDALPVGTLETLIAAASSAATSSNMQWWTAIAVTDPAVKKELAAIAGNQKHIEQCPLYLLWVADMARNQRISEAEKVAFETMPWLETFMVAAIDAALAAQNAVVAAESLGLGTVYIGAMRNDPQRVAALVGLPKQAVVVFGLCVGVPDREKPSEVKPRLPQSSVLHHGRYGATGEAADRAAYDRELAAFSSRNEMQTTTWTQRVRNRLGPIASMNGRERLRSILAAMGFELR
jgi:nitroreductase